MGIGLGETLVFPATFNSGNAPDVELPEGTSLRTKVKATNPEGSSTSLWSNRVLPGTSRLSLGMGETSYQLDTFTAGAQTMKTYEVRESENEFTLAQAAYDTELAAFNERLSQIRVTYEA